MNISDVAKIFKRHGKPLDEFKEMLESNPDAGKIGVRGRSRSMSVAMTAKE